MREREGERQKRERERESKKVKEREKGWAGVSGHAKDQAVWQDNGEQTNDSAKRKNRLKFFLPHQKQTISSPSLT